MYYILFNPKAGAGTGESKARKLDELLKGEELNYISVFDIKDYGSFLAELKEDDKIVIVGGDGSLNYFVNDIRGMELKNEVYFFAGGTGNDFLNDLGKDPEHGPYEITKYLKDLPSVKVNGQNWLFINGVGYGIDGYCCEVADQMHAAGETNVNYASIAIKGLLGKFKPRNHERTLLRRRNEQRPQPGQTQRRAKALAGHLPRKRKAQDPDDLPQHFQGRACQPHQAGLCLRRL